MGSLIVTYPGGYYDSELGEYVITRYAKQGKIAVMYQLDVHSGKRASDRTINVMLPSVIPDKVKVGLKKCYEFERWKK